MKVRMIFAHEHQPEGEESIRLLKVNEIHDLPPALAGRLIQEGRAEPVKTDTKADAK